MVDPHDECIYCGVCGACLVHDAEDPCWYGGRRLTNRDHVYPDGYRPSRRENPLPPDGPDIGSDVPGGGAI